MDGCGIYSSLLWYQKLYKTTRTGWEIAIFLKGTQNGQNAKGGPFAKFSILAIFCGRTLLGYKIVNTSPILA